MSRFHMENVKSKILSLYHSALQHEAHVNLQNPTESLEFFNQPPKRGKEKEHDAGDCMKALRDILENDEGSHGEFIFKNLCFGYQRNFMLTLCNRFEFQFLYSQFLREHYSLEFSDLSFIHFEIGLKILESIVNLGLNQEAQWLGFVYGMKKRDYDRLKLKYQTIKQRKQELEDKLQPKAANDNSNDNKVNESGVIGNFEDNLEYARIMNRYDHDDMKAMEYFDNCLKLDGNNWQVCIEYALLVNKINFLREARKEKNENDDDNDENDDENEDKKENNAPTVEEVAAMHKKADLTFKHGIELLVNSDNDQQQQQQEEIKDKDKLINGVTTQYTKAMKDNRRQDTDIDEIYSYVVNLYYPYHSPVADPNNLEKFKAGLNHSGFFEIRLDYIQFLLKCSEIESETNEKNQAKAKQNESDSVTTTGDNENKASTSNDNESEIKHEADEKSETVSRVSAEKTAVAVAMSNKCNEILDECKEAALAVINNPSQYEHVFVRVASLVLHKLCDAYSVASKHDEWVECMDCMIARQREAVDATSGGGGGNGDGNGDGDDEKEFRRCIMDLSNSWYYKGYLYETGRFDNTMAKECYKHAMDTCLEIKNLKQLDGYYCHYAMYMAVYANCVRMVDKDLERCELLLKEAKEIVDKINDEDCKNAKRVIESMCIKLEQEKKNGVGPEVRDTEKRLKELHRSGLTSFKTLSSFKTQ